MILQHEKNLSRVLQQETWIARAEVGGTIHEFYASTRRGAYQLLLASIGWKVYNGKIRGGSKDG